jgi:hypothetical protein
MIDLGVRLTCEETGPLVRCTRDSQSLVQTPRVLLRSVGDDVSAADAAVAGIQRCAHVSLACAKTTARQSGRGLHPCLQVVTRRPSRDYARWCRRLCTTGATCRGPSAASYRIEPRLDAGLLIHAEHLTAGAAVHLLAPTVPDCADVVAVRPCGRTFTALRTGTFQLLTNEVRRVFQVWFAWPVEVAQVIASHMRTHRARDTDPSGGVCSQAGPTPRTAGIRRHPVA